MDENLAPASAAAPPQTAEQINRPQTGQVSVEPPAPPPAAEIVAHGMVTNERLASLETELAREKSARESDGKRIKALETEIAERQRDIQELKKIPAAPAPPKRTLADAFL